MKITVQHGNHSFEVSEKDIKEEERIEKIFQEQSGQSFYGSPVLMNVMLSVRYKNVKNRYVLCPACGKPVYL